MNKKQKYEQAINCIVELVIEQHRFMKGIAKAQSKLEYIDQQKLIRQSKWISQNTEKVLDKLNMKTVDFTGQEYEPGLPVTALNKDCTDLVISEMLEPVIMKDEEVLHEGVVLLRRK